MGGKNRKILIILLFFYLLSFFEPFKTLENSKKENILKEIEETKTDY
ncbi:MAG: hypothetical protein ACKKMW_02470 [Candidatus Nealsonbacteria bacterium]